jgi:hypothetical protein
VFSSWGDANHPTRPRHVSHSVCDFIAVPPLTTAAEPAPPSQAKPSQAKQIQIKWLGFRGEVHPRTDKNKGKIAAKHRAVWGKLQLGAPWQPSSSNCALPTSTTAMAAIISNVQGEPQSIRLATCLDRGLWAPGAIAATVPWPSIAVEAVEPLDRCPGQRRGNGHAERRPTLAGRASSWPLPGAARTPGAGRPPLGGAGLAPETGRPRAFPHRLVLCGGQAQKPASGLLRALVQRRREARTLALARGEKSGRLGSTSCWPSRRRFERSGRRRAAVFLPLRGVGFDGHGLSGGSSELAHGLLARRRRMGAGEG